MRRLLLSLAVLVSLPLVAQQRIGGFAQEKTENWVMTRFIGDPLNVREYKFKNGLTLYTSNQATTKRVYTMVAVKTGSKNDPASNTGLAHYLEHMLFKGTDKYGTLDWGKEKPLLAQIDALYEKYNKTTDTALRRRIYRAIDSVSGLAAKWAIANEYDKMCGALGAEGTNAFTSNDQTVYINDIPNNKIGAWLALESERFRNPVLRLFHTELEAVYEEKNMSLDRDDDKVWETLFGELFKKHNYGLQTTIGTVEHLKNPSLEAIRQYYNTYYVAGNMAIVMSGDFNPDSVAADVWKNFAGMRTGDVPTYVYEYEDLRNVERAFDVVGPKSEYLTIGYRFPGAGSKESKAAQMISWLLSNNSTGLIDKNLVRKQMVLSAFAGVEQMNDYGVFLLMGEPQEGQTLDSVKTLLLQQMEKVRRGDFDEGLLKSIVLNKDIDQIKSFKENRARASFLMQAFVSGKTYRDAYNELYEMSLLTKEDLIDFANEYLNADRVVVYKRKGEKAASAKIDKPTITAVELNRDKRSDFVSKWLEIPAKPVEATVVDLEKEIKKVALNKGASELRYVTNPSNRLFRVAFRYEKGSWANPDLKILADYLTYVGGGGLTSSAIAEKMYKMGCSWEVKVSNLYTDVVVSGPEENFDEAVKTVGTVWKNIEVSDEVLKSLVSDLIKSREDSKTDPSVVRRMLSSYVIYGPKNPMNHGRSNAYLRALKASKMKELVADLGKTPMRVEYYGKRDVADLVKSLDVDKVFPYSSAAYKPGVMRSEVASGMFMEQESKERTVYFVHFEQVQASVNWWIRGSKEKESETSVVNMFNQYFGGDMSSVVFQNIREAKALAYSTYCFLRLPDFGGRNIGVQAFVGTQADKFHDAIAAMEELMNKMPQDPEVFALAKESLINRMNTSVTDPEDYLGMYTYLKNRGLSTEMPSAAERAIVSVGLADITAFHQRELVSKPWSLMVVADKKLIKKSDLSRYGKVIELSMSDIFGY